MKNITPKRIPFNIDDPDIEPKEPILFEKNTTDN